MSLPVMVILLVCACPLHTHVAAGDTQANHVCSGHMYQVAIELYHICAKQKQPDYKKVRGQSEAAL